MFLTVELLLTFYQVHICKSILTSGHKGGHFLFSNVSLEQSCSPCSGTSTEGIGGRGLGGAWGETHIWDSRKKTGG